MKNLKLIPILFLLINCRSSSVEKEGIEVVSESPTSFSTEHFNITIASDLSNRLNDKKYPKAVSDVEIISVLANNIYPTILTHKRSMNQKDQFRIDFINKQQISVYKVNTMLMEINFNKFKTQAERIKYLRKSYQNDKLNFVKEFARIHESAKDESFGSDIWTYLQQGINNFSVIKDVSKGNIMNKHRNILILLTDGYIETRYKNPGYELTGKRINEFRNEYLKSGDKNIESFFKRNQKYKINYLSNPLLQDLEILVLELYDRTETTSGATVHPTDLEIIKLIWHDWLVSSNAKRVELHSKFSNKEEAKKVIMKFIGI